MRLSIVIPTCHRNESLARCLEALAPGVQTLKAEFYEVIVTDDGIATNAEEVVKSRHSWAKWIEGPKRGPAANRNFGAAQAKHEWLVFTDDDCVPCQNCLEAYFVGATKCNALILEGKTCPLGTPSRVDSVCPVNETGGYLWSCNFAIERELFFKIGGFDENFPAAAMEDVEFRTRLLKLPAKIEFLPDALILHPWTQRKGFQYQVLHLQSVLYYQSKHPETALNRPLMAALKTLIRSLVRALLLSVRCRGKGAIREILLAFHYTILTIGNGRRAAERLK
jgi:GT2 family glycosyltransferase